MQLDRQDPQVLQLNLGKLCNLTCSHCHVNAGPHRKEVIQSDTVTKILDWFSMTNIPTLDLTGGTPEMIPDFRRIVEEVRNFSTPRKIIDRLNATIIEEPGYEWVAEFLARHEVEIIASMPCYEPENVEKQRGNGVFKKSISAFQKLNRLGYGSDSRLKIHFVYNPSGDFLPPDQVDLEAQYKTMMKDHFKIEFDQLYCITNMPIARFASWLKREGRLNDYNSLLKDAFNPETIDGLMCRDTINVNWLGEVFDCDFNQMLNLPTYNKKDSINVWEINLKEFSTAPIRTGTHCFGCTAGSGSSCGGSLLD
ncbi:MAG TPA: radical SAM/Cys-rich domain protein [Verrucomicrobia bacterium]|nr:radical SAM/Cys-rich domain protein [Verrucomicrobiales bacterium]HIL55421.1 radical SAM/Cys-rich domain protein [Verrucomicrobiota bacterium]